MFSVGIRDHCFIAHSLPDPFFGPAQGLHGATLTVEVEFRAAELDVHHIVIDIGKARTLVRELLAELDYKNLDQEPAFEGTLTTVEFLARHLHDKLRECSRDYFAGQILVTLHESPVAWVRYAGVEPTGKTPNPARVS